MCDEMELKTDRIVGAKLSRPLYHSGINHRIKSLTFQIKRVELNIEEMESELEGMREELAGLKRQRSSEKGG